jgi:hypothetical protein
MVSGPDGYRSFLLAKDDLARTAWHDAAVPSASGLEESEVLVAIERFAFTANNITYGLLGRRTRDLAFGYWDFFPFAGAWGQLPVWGVGEVIASRHGELRGGEKLYGFYPMATHLTLSIGSVMGAAVVDTSAHRRDLPATYNHYVRTAQGLPFDDATLDAYMILRPPFSLSFCCAMYLEEQHWFGARRVVISSASSKAALGLALLLKEARPDGLEVIGLTSAARVRQLESFGMYDRVAGYDQVSALPNNTPTVLVDIANAAVTTRAVHDRLGCALRASLVAGFTHGLDRDGSEAPSALPGPSREFFLAPVHMQRLQDKWGEAVYWRRFGEAWQRFRHAVAPWLTIERVDGAPGVERIYRQALAGEAPNDRAHILSLWS